jgi:hypothetical protein
MNIKILIVMGGLVTSSFIYTMDRTQGGRDTLLAQELMAHYCAKMDTSEMEQVNAQSFLTVYKLAYILAHLQESEALDQDSREFVLLLADKIVPNLGNITQEDIAYIKKNNKTDLPSIGQEIDFLRRLKKDLKKIGQNTQEDAPYNLLRAAVERRIFSIGLADTLSRPNAKPKSAPRRQAYTAIHMQKPVAVMHESSELGSFLDTLEVTEAITVQPEVDATAFVRVMTINEKKALRALIGLPGDYEGNMPQSTMMTNTCAMTAGYREKMKEIASLEKQLRTIENGLEKMKADAGEGDRLDLFFGMEDATYALAELKEQLQQKYDELALSETQLESKVDTAQEGYQSRDVQKNKLMRALNQLVALIEPVEKTLASMQDLRAELGAEIDQLERSQEEHEAQLQRAQQAKFALATKRTKDVLKGQKPH